MATGANTTPLGRLNPILAARQNQMQQTSMLPPQRTQSNLDSNSRQQLTAHIEAAKRAAAAVTSHLPKKRKSRWGAEEVKSTSVPTQLPSSLSDEEQKKYLIHIRIEELNRMLRTGDLGIPERQEERSPSPEPVYDHKGVRLNTRESRVRKKLEDERHKHIQDALKLNPDYKPPADYKPPVVKIQDKVMIPQDEHPHINFIGLLIGPRGNTLKKLEKDTNTKVMIRGKGSVKEGKLPRPGMKDNNAEDEPLHALITGQTVESVKKCVDRISDVIKQGVEAPEGQSDLKRMQLLELAALNGTLRSDEVVRCRNCGATTHKTWECPEQTNITNEVMCAACGGRGHVAKDCIMKNKPQTEGETSKNTDTSLIASAPVNAVMLGFNRGKIDTEYQSFMAELGQAPQPMPGAAVSGASEPSRAAGAHIPPPTSLMGNDNVTGVTILDRTKTGTVPMIKPAFNIPSAPVGPPGMASPPWARPPGTPVSSAASSTPSGLTGTPMSRAATPLMPPGVGNSPMPYNMQRGAAMPPVTSVIPGTTMPPGAAMPSYGSSTPAPPGTVPPGSVPAPPGVSYPMPGAGLMQTPPTAPGSSIPPWQQAAPVAPWQAASSTAPPPPGTFSAAHVQPSYGAPPPPGTQPWAMAPAPPRPS